MGPQDDLVHARIASMAREGKAFVGAAGNGGPHAPAGYPAAYGGGPWDFKGLMLAQLLSKDELKTRSPVYRHGLMRAPSTCASARSWVSSVKLEPLQPAPVLPAARVEPTPTVPGGWHASVQQASLAPDLTAFQDFVIDELTAAPNVASVKTTLIIRRVKFEPGVPVALAQRRCAG